MVHKCLRRVKHLYVKKGGHPPPSSVYFTIFSTILEKVASSSFVRLCARRLISSWNLAYTSWKSFQPVSVSLMHTARRSFGLVSLTMNPLFTMDSTRREVAGMVICMRLAKSLSETPSGSSSSMSLSWEMAEPWRMVRPYISFFVGEFRILMLSRRISSRISRSCRNSKCGDFVQTMPA